MDENLLGYLLNSLDEATHAQVEAYLHDQPQARARLEKLRRTLTPLEADRAGLEAPADLPMRSLALVAEHLCRELPRAPRPNMQPFTGSRPLWRRLDVAIAASILFVAVTLLFPGIAYLRHRQDRLVCANNLKEFSVALRSYQDAHREPPRFDTQKPPRNVVGLVAPMLRENGLLNPASLRCPGSGDENWCNLSVQQIQNLSPQEFQQQAPQFIPCYAYSLGYRDESGEYHFPAVPEGFLASAVPLMADRPPAQVQAGGNSPNHGGDGQNVLFHDGSVWFLTNRKFGPDDIYLNDCNQVAAGLTPFDTVLASSEMHP